MNGDCRNPPGNVTPPSAPTASHNSDSQGKQTQDGFDVSTHPLFCDSFDQRYLNDPAWMALTTLLEESDQGDQVGQRLCGSFKSRPTGALRFYSDDLSGHNTSRILARRSARRRSPYHNQYLPHRAYRYNVGTTSSRGTRLSTDQDNSDIQNSKQNKIEQQQSSDTGQGSANSPDMIDELEEDLASIHM